MAKKKGAKAAKATQAETKPSEDGGLRAKVDGKVVQSTLELLHEGRKVAAVYFTVAELRKWDRNPRKIPQQAIDKVAAVISQCGWGAPVIARASDKRLIAGHTRLAAAEQLGIVEVPCRFLEVTDEQADILAVADNRLGQEAEWDFEKLADVLRSFENDSMQLLTGFDKHEIEPLLAAEWQPPTVGDLPSRGGGTTGAGHGAVKAVVLTEEQRAMLDDALELARKEFGEDVTEGAFIADLCARYAKVKDVELATARADGPAEDAPVAPVKTDAATEF